jgi:hypothetical protein
MYPELADKEFARMRSSANIFSVAAMNAIKTAQQPS